MSSTATCHIDGKWKGTIDQIFITPGMLGHHKGDIWIDWIEVTSGLNRPKPHRPDIVSDKVIPKISIPGITQEDFKDAFRVLDEGMYIDVPFQGFEYPFFAPGSGGSGYGWSCWPGDGTIVLGAVKWSNQKVAENVIRNFYPSRMIFRGNNDVFIGQ